MIKSKRISIRENVELIIEFKSSYIPGYKAEKMKKLNCKTI